MWYTKVNISINTQKRNFILNLHEESVCSCVVSFLNFLSSEINEIKRSMERQRERERDSAFSMRQSNESFTSINTNDHISHNMETGNHDSQYQNWETWMFMFTN